MEKLLECVNSNTLFQTEYNITEASVRELFADDPSSEEIDNILDIATNMCNAVDFDTLDNVTKKANSDDEDDEDLFSMPLNMTKEDFKENDEELYNIEQNNLFYAPLAALNSTQLLALNIANNIKVKNESQSSLTSHYLRLPTNSSANNRVNTLVSPMYASTKLNKKRLNTFKELISETNPDILKRLKSEIVRSYDMGRSLMYNKNTIGGQNSLLDERWHPEFPNNLSLNHLNTYSALHINNLDKIKSDV